MIKRFKNKKLQILVFLAAIQIFILFNIIIPSYENKPYFEKQVQQLERDLELKLGQKFYLEERQKVATQKLALNQKELSRLIEKYSEENLQITIGKLLRENSIQVLTQQINKSGNRPDLQRYILSQTLEGKYEQLSTYLATLLDGELPLVLAEASIENLEPQERSPLLGAKLIFYFFRPNI